MKDDRFEFNFTGLKDVYSQARQEGRLTFAFTVEDGKGHLSFLVRTPQDKNGEARINESYAILALRGTRRWTRVLLLGNHLRAGNFKVRFSTSFEHAMRAELGVSHASSNRTALETFLGAINTGIPRGLTDQDWYPAAVEVKEVMGDRWASEIDNPERTHLRSFPHLKPPKRPREKTLLKLLDCGKPAHETKELIELLREKNMTVAWSEVRTAGDPWFSRPRRGSRQSPAKAAS